MIEVPGQPEADRPYLATRVVDEGGQVFEAVVVPRREGSRVVSLSPGEVHRLLGDGRRRRSLADLPTPTDDRPDRLLETIEGAQGWTDLPVYLLQALPPPGSRGRLADFYGSTGPRDALVHIDLLRPMGFNLRIQGDITVRDGAITYLDDPRRAIWVEPDGLFTAGAVATADYLGRGGGDASGCGAVRLNPVAVVEWTLEFFRFLVGHIWPAAESSAAWTCRIVCRRFVSGGPVALARGLPSPSGFEAVAMPASTDQWSKTIQVGGDPAVDAFNALIEFYALFGQPDSAIPLSEGGRVSQQKLFAVRG